MTKRGGWLYAPLLGSAPTIVSLLRNAPTARNCDPSSSFVISIALLLAASPLPPCDLPLTHGSRRPPRSSCRSVFFLLAARPSLAPHAAGCCTASKPPRSLRPRRVARRVLHPAHGHVARLGALARDAGAGGGLGGGGGGGGRLVLGGGVLARDSLLGAHRLRQQQGAASRGRQNRNHGVRLTEDPSTKRKQDAEQRCAHNPAERSATSHGTRLLLEPVGHAAVVLLARGGGGVRGGLRTQTAVNGHGNADSA